MKKKAGHLVSKFTARQGGRYRATLSLGLLQSLATNEMIKDKLQDLGFTEVVVKGRGSTRTAEGVWPLADASAELPPEFTDVTEIDV